MKKTTPTSIANTLFHIEEDAFRELDSYLASIRSHFASHPDRDEIIKDIESRIAEHFIEETGSAPDSGTRIVTMIHVQKIIESMGSPDDFDMPEGDRPTRKAPATRKLYRDRANAAIGGVAAGLAAFFGIDVTWVRVGFLLSVLAGGTGILIYIILWLAIPEAETTTQKLEMRGDPITLESVTEVVNQKMEEVKSHKGTLAAIASVPLKIVSGVFNFIAKKIIPIVGKIIGVFMIFLAILLLIILISGLIIGFLYPDASYIDFVLRDIASGTLYYLSIIISFFLLAIPLLFVGALGTLFMGRKPAIAGRLGGILFGIWLLAIIAGIVTGFSIHDRYQYLSLTDPRFQHTNEVRTPGEFTSVSVTNGEDITYVPGDEFRVTLEGRRKDIEEMRVEIKDGALTVRREEPWRICFFCIHRQVNVTVESPTVDALTATNGSYITARNLSHTAEMMFIAENGSRIAADGMFTSLNVRAENSSRITLIGSASSTNAIARNAARIDAEQLAVDVMNTEASNSSHVEVRVHKNLTAKAYNGSRIRQYGEALLTESTSDGSSSVRSTTEDTRSFE